ncbi:MAG: 4-hydroxy-3-methylbut-2-enyl diphosphate reductase [Planctomycetota bacterium]|nr:4-hydroxy-3-methylbut-2-enyl diphosphate reductase [Planctomycetota bacterium]
MKRVILARNAGFCSGVQRAVALALKAVKQSRRLYTLGDLIHNRQVVEALSKKGVVPIRDTSSLKAGDTVLIRSHGVEKEVKDDLEKRNICFIDATCPNVMRIHGIISRAREAGERVVIFGDRGHPEVKALCSVVPDAFLISLPDEVELLPREDRVVCFVSQTTQNKEVFERIAARLKERFKEVRVHNTICRSTTERQEELKELLKEAECVVVVGGGNSANTKRLVEISEAAGRKTYRIETAQDLRIEELKNYNTIGVAAGASTPRWVIKEVVQRIRSAVGEKSPFFMPLLRFLVRGNILSSASAAALTIFSLILLDIPFHLSLVLVAALYVFGVHTANQLIALKQEPLGETLSVFFYLRGFSSAAAAVLSVIILIQFGFFANLFLVMAIVAGLLYGVEILPARLALRSLKDIPGSKEIFCAVGWASVASILPVLAFKKNPSFTTVMTAFALAFFPVYLRSILFDVRQMERDSLMGRETTILALGSQSTRRIIAIVICGWFGLLVFAEIFRLFRKDIGVAFTMPLWFAAVLLLRNRKFFNREWVVESFLDLGIVISALLFILC